MDNYKEARKNFLDYFIKHTHQIKSFICKLESTSNLKKENYKRFYEELYKRGDMHDIDKINNNQLYTSYINMYCEYKGKKYDTPAHKKVQEKYKNIIEEHFKNSPHHPQHYSNGYQGMNFIDKIEMVMDWCSVMVAGKETNVNKDFEKNLLFNKYKFNIPDDEFEYILSFARFLVFDNDGHLPKELVILVNKYERNYLSK